MYESPLPDLELPKGNVVEDWLKSPNLQSRIDHPIVSDALTKQSFTPRQIIDGMGKYAALLRSKYGIEENSVVCIFTFNSIFHPILHLGILSLGAQISPANVMYTPEELAHQLRVVQPRLIICAPENAKTTQEAIQLANFSTQVITLDQAASEIRDLLQNQNAPSVSPIPVDGPEQHAYYCFSSGTTGLPKAVITTQGNINAQFRQMNAVNHLMLKPGSRMTAFLPMSHIYGLTLFLWCASYAAAHIVVFPKFELETVLRAICDFDIEFCPLVPPVAVLLGKSPVVDKYPIHKHLKAIMSGAAPLAKSTGELCRARIPNLTIHQAYGLTESSPFTHAVLGGFEDKYESSIGWLLPNVKARLVDPITEMDAEPGKPGELWLHGPNIMKGYYKNEQATEHTLSHGNWLKTGDVAIVDPKTQQFYIVDRIKELIKSKGHQVAPAELEALLLTHPHVQDVAVVGVNDSTESTELPRAFLVLQPGVLAHEVVAWFNSKVAKHKRLWGGAVLMDAIPKSPSGKILRRLLKDHKADEIHGVDKSKL